MAGCAEHAGDVGADDKGLRGLQCATAQQTLRPCRSCGQFVHEAGVKAWAMDALMLALIRMLSMEMIELEVHLV